MTSAGQTKGSFRCSGTGPPAQEGPSSPPWVAPMQPPGRTPVLVHCSGLKPSPGTPGATGAAAGQDQQRGLGTWFYDPIQKEAEQGHILKNLKFHLHLWNLSCCSWFTQICPAVLPCCAVVQGAKQFSYRRQTSDSTCLMGQRFLLKCGTPQTRWAWQDLQQGITALQKLKQLPENQEITQSWFNQGNGMSCKQWELWIIYPTQSLGAAPWAPSLRRAWDRPGLWHLSTGTSLEVFKARNRLWSKLGYRRPWNRVEQDALQGPFPPKPLCDSVKS